MPSEYLPPGSRVHSRVSRHLARIALFPAAVVELACLLNLGLEKCIKVDLRLHYGESGTRRLIECETSGLYCAHATYD
jgi:hypothetical protein